MLSIEETKQWTLKHITEFLEQLRNETDPGKIEGLTYTLMRTAEHAYKHLYDLNAKVRP